MKKSFIGLDKYCSIPNTSTKDYNIFAERFVSEFVTFLKKQGAKAINILSRNTMTLHGYFLLNRVLWYFSVIDPKDRQMYLVSDRDKSLYLSMETREIFIHEFNQNIIR